MYSIMNCTPHAISILATLCKGEVLVFGSQSEPGLHAPHRRRVAQDHVIQDAFVIPPSGYRLACHAWTSGPDLGCDVTYELTGVAQEEKDYIWTCFAQSMGVDMIVIASEISVRALAGSLFDSGGGLPIRAMWPVLAAESLRMPMGNRWADKLATLPEVTR